MNLQRNTIGWTVIVPRIYWNNRGGSEDPFAVVQKLRVGVMTRRLKRIAVKVRKGELPTKGFGFASIRDKLRRRMTMALAAEALVAQSL